LPASRDAVDEGAIRYRRAGQYDAGKIERPPDGGNTLLRSVNQSAKHFISDFEIATECGMARVRTPEQVTELLRVRPGAADQRRPMTAVNTVLIVGGGIAGMALSIAAQTCVR
jgi:hypothetical protein